MNSNIKSEIRLKKNRYKHLSSEEKKRTHNIFLPLPYLNNIQNNRNDCYKTLKNFNATYSTNMKSCFQDKIKTILIDKKVCKNLFNDISNKNINNSNKLTNTQYTGFFVIPTTEKSVSIEQVNIPITPNRFANSKNSLTKNSYTDKILFNKKFRFGGNKYSMQNKLPVGEIFKSRGIKLFKIKKQKNDFEVGGKFRSEEKDSRYMERNIFNENVKKLIEEDRLKKLKKRKGPMNCREILEYIKNERCAKTTKLIKQTIEDKNKSKNNLSLFFKDFRKYCNEFDNWNDNDDILI